MDGATPLPMISHAAHSAAVMEKLMAHPRAADLVLRRFLGGITVDHDPEFARGMRATLLKIGAAVLPIEAFPAVARATGVTRQIHEAALHAHVRGEPVVWFSWPVPAAIIASFGVVTYCLENFFSVANATGPDGSTRMCEVAERHGVPVEVCSINRCVLGAYLAGELPKPTLVVTSNSPCDGNHTGNTILRDMADCEHFGIGGPYDKSPESVAVWAKSAWELIGFLESRLKRPLNWDLLRSHCEAANRVNRALQHVTELHRNAPCPGLINPMAVFWRIVVSQGWNAQMAEAAELLEKAALELVEKARKRGEGRERMRVIMGDQAISWTDFGSWMRKEYGAAIVADYLGAFRYSPIDTSTREKMIEGLVRERLYMSMVRQSHGAMEYPLEELAATLSEYDADCVIFHSHVGCKHNMALRRQVEDLCREAKVPALFLDADIIDNRVVGEKALRDKIRTFLAAEGLPR